MTADILPREFYCRDTVRVAKDLLGKRVTRKIGRQKMTGIITETEAYRYKDDPASHAFKKMTERNKAMFGEVGRAYVYFTYGMYFCFNVVARKPTVGAGAVLIRAILPEKGIDIMRKNRTVKDRKNLTNGPAKMTQAMQITKKQYGVDLTRSSEIFISNGLENTGKIVASNRIGIREATDRLWNFKIAC